MAMSYTMAPKSEPLCRNHREGAPQQTKCCLGGSDAAQQGKHCGLPQCLPLETRTGGMLHVLLDPHRSFSTHNSPLNRKLPKRAKNRAPDAKSVPLPST